MQLGPGDLRDRFPGDPTATQLVSKWGPVELATVAKVKAPLHGREEVVEERNLINLKKQAQLDDNSLSRGAGAGQPSGEGEVPHPFELLQEIADGLFLRPLPD